MNGSLNDNTVVQLNTDFQMAHPGWKVNYQVQQWNGIVDKLTTALASNTPPDVIEMGNTQAITFEAAGALADLTSSRAALGGGTSNDSASADQLFVASLNSASVYQDKLFALPFYAGDRVLIYRKDLLPAAGHRSRDDHEQGQAHRRGQDAPDRRTPRVKDFSGFYVAGQNWYSLLQMIWDRGGALATNADGKWTANLESPESMQGIQDYVDYYKAGSTGPKDNDEMNPPEYDLFHQGKVGMFVGNGWEIGSAIGTDGEAHRRPGRRHGHPERDRRQDRPGLPRRLRPRHRGQEPEPGGGPRLAQAAHERRRPAAAHRQRLDPVAQVGRGRHPGHRPTPPS